MRVIIIEKMFFLCLIYNALLLFLNTYINHRKNYKQMFLLAIVFSFLDIVSIYIGSTVLYIMFMFLFFAVPIYLSKVNVIREIFVICGLVFLCVGAYSIIPIKNIYINICVVIISIVISGVIPVFQKNYYIRTTLASIKFKDGKKISALIDTGIVTENAPLVIVKLSCIKKIMPDMPELSTLDIDTVDGYGNIGGFVVDEIEVSVNGTKRVINNATIAVSFKELPWDALISAQGLV